MRRYFLLLPHLKIQNANAMSSPYTIGFPAITAWLGATHALQRQLHNHGYADIILDKLAISCHSLNVQRCYIKGNSTALITVSRNPLIKKGKEYVPPDLLPEARCYVEVSLLIELGDSAIKQIFANSKEEKKFYNKVSELVYTMKWASGDVLSLQADKVKILLLNEEDEDNGQQLKKVRQALWPGHILIERRSLIKTVQQQEQNADTLQILLEYLKITKAGEESNDKGKTSWTRKSPGWLVPIAVGFQGVTALAQDRVTNQRDEQTTHGFAESVVTLGEFITSFRVKNIDEILWRYEVDLDENLYLCKNESGI